MKSLFIIDIGVSDQMPMEEVVRIRIVNVYILFALLAVIPEMYLFHAAILPFPAISLIFPVCFMLTWVFQRMRAYLFAKLWFYLCIFGYVLTMGSILGRSAGLQVILIPTIFGAILVFDHREKFAMITVVILNLLIFPVLEITGYSIFTASVLLSDDLRSIFFYNMILAISASVVAGGSYLYMYESRIRQNEKIVGEAFELEKTISYFANSLFGKNTVDEILWDVAKNCISRLGFEDCTVYLLDHERQTMMEKAAHGPKNLVKTTQANPKEWVLGEGVVGHVAFTGEPVIVSDTTMDERFDSSETRGLSELAVPLIYGDLVIGVIDSVHRDENFFTHRHLEILQTIAAICTNKVAGALADIEREEARTLHLEAEKIKDFDELKTKLFTNISHELRTPLTLIKGSISRHLHPGEHTDWQHMDTQTDRLLRLSDQLLDLTHLESGQYRLRPKPRDLSSFILAIADQFKEMAAERKIHISVNITPIPLFVYFDSDALEKIFYNLISNALKYSFSDSTVEIRAEYRDALHLEVSDAGQGIPQELLQKIFDRFYRVDKDRQKGSGIGLALTYELIKLHGGAIRAENHPKGGAIIIADIPLKAVDTPPEDILDDNEEHHLKSALKGDERAVVLVIEDNREILRFIREILRDQYQVLTAIDGLEGMTIIEEQLPDLVICDIMMPEMNGMDLCRKVREKDLTQHIPLLMLTAKADRDSKLEGLRSGADDYIIKPFDQEELKLRVYNHLERQRQFQNKYAQLGIMPSAQMPTVTTEDIFIKKLADTVDRKMADSDFSVSSLSSELGMSRMQLHRKITAITGHSIQVFIRKRRMQRAAYLLGTGHFASATAYDVGYNSLSHFSKVFKEEFGVSPSEYGASIEAE